MVVLANRDEFFLGTEIKVPEATLIRNLVGYKLTICPHIMTSNTCKGVFYPNSR